MINNEMFTKRLQLIFDHYGLSASAFAEKLGVGRSSISHIISGRNKPSLDFVLHILDTFEEVSFDWLLLGKGSFPENSNKIEAPTLFQNRVIEDSNLETKEIPTEKLYKQTVTNSKLETEINNDDHIERIIIFYSNGSFKEYKN